MLPLLRFYRNSISAFACQTPSAAWLGAWKGFSSEALAAKSPAGGELPSRETVEAELTALGRQLRRESHIDGTKRLQLSTDVFRVTVPKHEVEPDLMSIDVHLRPECGSTISKWLRRAKRVTGRVISLPGNAKLMIHMEEKDADKLVRLYGLRGCEARLVALRILHPEDASNTLAVVRVKPQQVRLNAVNLRPQNVDFMFVPRNRTVRVQVPIRLANSDASAGVRKGGWLQVLRRTVEYECRGDSIPPFIEVDTKALDLDGAVRVRDLQIPAGTRLRTQTEFDDVVVRCTSQGGDEVRLR